MRSRLRLASVIGAFALTTVAVTPAMAAAPVAQAGANAVTLSIAGNGQGSGDVTATNDGSGEQKTGETAPPVGVLGGKQQLIRTGALAQEATAQVTGGKGTSAACAGLAGAGGSVVRIGETNCLSNGKGSLKLSIANLDLSDTEVINADSALGAVDTAPIAAALGQVTSALATGVADANQDLANLGLDANLDAISSHCTASQGAADGDSDFTGVNVSLNVPSQDPVTLLALNAHYPPNTELGVNLDKVADVLLKAVEEDIRTSLTGAFAPLADEVVAPVREALVQQVLSQVAAQLGPLNDVLQLTLNKQVRDGADSIKVRALDLSVLNAAQDQLGAPALSLQVGNSACGPNGRVASSVVAAPEAAPTALPTAVSAGYETMPGQHAGPADDSTNTIVLGAFAVLLASAAGFLTFRRLRG